MPCSRSLLRLWRSLTRAVAQSSGLGTLRASERQRQAQSALQSAQSGRLQRGWKTSPVSLSTSLICARGQGAGRRSGESLARKYVEGRCWPLTGPFTGGHAGVCHSASAEAGSLLGTGDRERGRTGRHAPKFTPGEARNSPRAQSPAGSPCGGRPFPHVDPHTPLTRRAACGRARAPRAPPPRRVG